MIGGSSWTYLPRDRGEVVSGCFGTDLNPKAPEEVLIGYGKQRVSSAKRLVEQNTSIPVFIHRASKQWEFVGYYRGKEFSEAPSEVTSKARAVNLDGRVAGVLYLEKVNGV